MKVRVFTLVVFAGLTIWAAIREPWVAPGLAALTASRVVIIIIAARKVRREQIHTLLFGQLALGYFGIAYLACFLVGSPATEGFWIVFAVIALIFLPILALASRALLRRSSPRG